ncbi:MAG TPA: hypothetical protein VGO34_14975 [Alphaproteobacteria bacterium]|jgi:TolA-binding protein
MLTTIFNLVGGWKQALAIGLIVVGMGGTILVQQLRIANLRTDAADLRTDVAKLNGDIEVLKRDKAQAVESNARLAAQVEELTEARDSQSARAAAAGEALAKAKTTIQANTAAILKEAHHDAAPADDAPVPPGMRAALRGLRERYGSAHDH